MGLPNLPITKERLELIAKVCGLESLEIPLEELITLVNAGLSDKLPKRVLPTYRESLAVTVVSPKVAALSYDRVLNIPPFTAGLPDDVGFFCATEREVFLFYMLAYIYVALKTKVLPTQEALSPAEIPNKWSGILRDLCKSIEPVVNRTPTIYFNSYSEYSDTYHDGPQQILTAAIEHLAMVDESALCWEQVLEFRKDAEARIKYRRLIHWLDDELKTKSPAEVQDLIAFRLDEYEWGIKKHGMKTAIGCLSCVLDPKFLASAAAVVGASTLAGGELWAALSTATLTVGRAVVSFGKSYIDALDERRKDNHEVAYIHDIKKVAK